MLGGIVTSTTAAAVTATLDTGTLMETAFIALSRLAVSDYFEFSVIATGANGFTIATAPAGPMAAMRSLPLQPALRPASASVAPLPTPTRSSRSHDRLD
jgi:hypothetical protein